MRLFEPFRNLGKAGQQDDESVRATEGDLTDAERRHLSDRLLLTRWLRSATPTPDEVDQLRWVLPGSLSHHHFSFVDPAQMADIHAALAANDGIAACLRRNGLSLVADRCDEVMSLVWMACGEGDALARLWMVDAISGRLVDAPDAEAAQLAALLKEHVALLGLGTLSYDEGEMRSLVAALALGPVDSNALAAVPEHERMVEAHIDALLSLRLGDGWREAHRRAMRRLSPGLPPSPRPPQVPDEFLAEVPDPDPFPEPPPPAVDAPYSMRVTGAAFSAAEKHLKRYASLERPLGLACAPALAGLGDALLADLPWLADPIRRIVGQQRLRARGSSPWFRMRPILLVGPPGAGKTRLARKLSQETGIPLRRINAGGRSGAIELLGHSPAYREAHASAPVSAMAEHELANPILLVDEIDKFGSSDYNGDPRHALVGMLEPETSRAFHDDFLRTEVDISQANFIFTANSLEGLSSALLDRMDVFRVVTPGPEHFDGILASITEEIAFEAGLSPDELPPLPPRAVRALRKAFTAGTSTRRLKNAVSAALECGAVASLN